MKQLWPWLGWPLQKLKNYEKYHNIKRTLWHNKRSNTEHTSFLRIELGKLERLRWIISQENPWKLKQIKLSEDDADTSASTLSKTNLA